MDLIARDTKVRLENHYYDDVDPLIDIYKSGIAILDFENDEK